MQNEMKVFAEATLGNTVDNSKRAGFIKYDRNVLRFQAVWDDRESLYGDLQRFEVRHTAALLSSVAKIYASIRSWREFVYLRLGR